MDNTILDLGKDFIMIKLLTDEDYEGVADIAVNKCAPAFGSGGEVALKLATVVQLSSAVGQNNSVKTDDIVVIDDASIVYYLDETFCIIEKGGILCGFDLDERECIAFKSFSTIIVVKESITPDDIFLLNPLVQNRLVVIGGFQSNTFVTKFDQAVVITASPTQVKHLNTEKGDYFICTSDDVIFKMSEEDGEDEDDEVPELTQPLLL